MKDDNITVINAAGNPDIPAADTDNICILAVESSCDETSAAVVSDGRYVLSNVIASQINIHKEYGGVVPEIASRKHIECINPVIRQALAQAGKSLDDIDAVCVTYGPGLIGSLLVGVGAAKAIAYAANKPLVGVHHISGHISANYIEHKELKPPFICLVVSGGHTNIVEVKDYGVYNIIGRTRDDAVGEAFDKVARTLGLGYPGGPKIDKLAMEGDSLAVKFPRGHIEGSPYDFSFSGIKSAVLNYVNSCNMKNESFSKADVAASFQEAVIDVLVGRTIAAAKEYGYNQIAMSGGVACNLALRKAMKDCCDKEGFSLYYPSPVLCTDNAAMIGAAGYYEYMNGMRHDLNLNAVANLEF